MADQTDQKDQKDQADLKDQAGRIELGRVRQLWHLLEPLHAVVYFAPEAAAEADGLGIESGRWPRYFAWRAAPLGAVGHEQVTSAFYSFSPGMVREHIPSVWGA
ncbi:hypothetical protein AB0I84_46040, partial [Streptomyces spectabilis]